MFDRRTPIEERFARHFIPEPNSGCWLWTGAINSSGYGSINEGGSRPARILSAHRVAWEMFCGPLTGEQVLHRCDVRSCVNPAHMFLGTNSDNVADRVAKGRSAVMLGQANPRASMSDRIVVEIYNAVGPYRSIAIRFGVSLSSVQQIKAGRNWSSLTGGIPNKRGQAVGEDVGGAKLTASKVLGIRTAKGTQRQIASLFGVSQQTVSMVRLRKVWGHV